MIRRDGRTPATGRCDTAGGCGKPKVSAGWFLTSVSGRDALIGASVENLRRRGLCHRALPLGYGSVPAPPDAFPTGSPGLGRYPPLTGVFEDAIARVATDRRGSACAAGVSRPARVRMRRADSVDVVVSGLLHAP